MKVKILIFFTVFTLVCGFTGATYMLKQRLEKPLSEQLLKNINFVPYYPKVLPPYYSKVEGSEKHYDGILFFEISDGSKTVKISQQKAPIPPPNLDGLQDFKKIQTISGKAVMGTQNLRAVGVLLTTTTLISVTGGEGVPEDVIGIIIQSLQYIPR